MNKVAIATAVCALFCGAAFANPFDAFKGRMKEGMYEYKMEMDMSGVPGLPPGMGKQTNTFQKCLTAKDIEKGHIGRGTGRDGKPPETCDIKDFKMNGNTATYSMTCKEPPMSANNQITMTDNGFKMDMKMAMSQGGQMMNMNQKMEGKYLGPCK